MAYDSVRRQLDQLLGVDRNELHRRRETPEVLNHSDPRVCKDFLLGLCLASLPDKRIGSDVPCDKVHSEQVLARFREDDKRGRVRDKVVWQRDLAAACRAKVLDEDRRIQSIARRLKDMYGFNEPVNAIIVRDLSTLQSLGLLVGGVGDNQDGSESDDEDLIDGDYIDHGRVRAEASHSDPPSTSLSGTFVLEHGTHDHVEPTIRVLNVSSGTAPDSPSGNASHPTTCSRAGGTTTQSDCSKCNSNETAPIDSNSSDLGKSLKNSSTNLKESCPGATSSSHSAPATNALGRDSSSDHGSEMVSKEPPAVDSSDRCGEASACNSSEVQNKSVLKGEWTGNGPGGLLLNREYKLRVCGQCGGLISLHDAESRLATHYSGKAHTSAVAVREKLRDLDAILRSLGPSEEQGNAMKGENNTGYRGLKGDSRSKRLRGESLAHGGLNGARLGATGIDKYERPGGFSPRSMYRRDPCPDPDPRGLRNGRLDPGSTMERHGNYSRDYSHRTREESRRHKRSRSRSPVPSGRGYRGRSS
jgi:hypothetical protein